MDLEDFRVHYLPDSVFYVPGFLSDLEEAFLIDRISKTPTTKWTQLRNRRLQNWGGLPHAKGMIPEEMPSWLDVRTNLVGEIVTYQEMKQNDVIVRVMGVGSQVFEQVRPNHILLNEYLPGQGISPHLDGDLFYPTIATVSLGSHTVLNYYRPLPMVEKETAVTEDSTQLNNRLEFSLFLEPRSLLLVKDKMYTDFLHGIDDRTSDELTDKVITVSEDSGRKVGQVLERGTRISLTIRHVPKTLKKFKLKF